MRIRVLVVDDAVVVRRMVADALADDATLEVVGVAAHGRIALAKIEQLNPDVVTLDIEMPEMDGMETLAAIRTQYPTLPVIMFSTLTERGARVTLNALARGANDYVMKPANVGSVTAALAQIREQLIPKIKAHCGRISQPAAEPPPPPRLTPARRAPTTRSRRPRSGEVRVVAIGVSTGGPNALGDLLPTLPSDFPIPVVLVQHMPPLFTKLLADRLSDHTAIPVREAHAGVVVEPGTIWIAPGDFHMSLSSCGDHVCVQTHQAPPVNSCRPSVDVLFQSAAQVFGRGVLAVVLTGMGHDGLRGCEHVREAGGQVIVQDEASSVIWGMPGFVARAGLADRVLPLSQIGEHIRFLAGGTPDPHLAGTRE